MHREAEHKALRTVYRVYTNIISILLRNHFLRMLRNTPQVDKGVRHHADQTQEVEHVPYDLCYAPSEQHHREA